MNKRNTYPDLPALGENLHRERRRRQMSLDTLALASGVSKAMLSQIESGKVNPTIGTMWKIAHALSIDFDTLIKGSGTKVKKFDVVRKEDATLIHTDNSSAVFRVLSPLNMAEELELYLMTLPLGCVHRSNAHTRGAEEFLTILSGSVKVTAGENSIRLGQGDTLVFQTDIEHIIENTGRGKAELHMAVRFPEH